MPSSHTRTRRSAERMSGNLCRCGAYVNIVRPSVPRQARAPGSGCSAVGGYTRYHAVLGTDAAPDASAPQTCIATHPSDMAVALAALDARVRLRGPDGDREIAFTELHRLPGGDPSRNTVLQHGELITAIDLPPLPRRHAVGVPEGARPRVVRVRAGVGGSGPAGGRRPGRRRADRPRGSGPQAVAGAPGRGGAARPARDRGKLPRRRRGRAGRRAAAIRPGRRQRVPGRPPGPVSRGQGARAGRPADPGRLPSSWAAGSDRKATRTPTSSSRRWRPVPLPGRPVEAGPDPPADVLPQPGTARPPSSGCSLPPTTAAG